MKNFVQYTLILVVFPLSLFSCKNALDIDPENIIGTEDVFSNESAIEAYLATLYNNIPLQDLNFQLTGISYMSELSGESINNAYRWKSTLGDGTWLHWWGYAQVRDVNEFIANIKSSSLSSEERKQLVGEARFIRAYYYFELVKRYGGVPLITVVQNFNGNNLDSLKVPRNTEKEIYDFVGTELDTAARLMSQNSPQQGRANRFVAYALKSRAMLYAASEAAYGNLQLDGLIGMPKEEAEKYWQEAYDAAKVVIDSGGYALYNKYPDDKTANFANLFLDTDNNSEVIFARYYHYPEKTNSWDFRARPKPENGGHVAPTLEMAEAFEYMDGSEGKLEIASSQGEPIEYKDPADLFKNKDPRFAATILYPFSSWPTGMVEVRAGIIDDGKTITTGNYNNLYKGMHIIGDHGIGGNLGNSPTGFYVRKYLDPSYTEEDASVSKGNVQPYNELRYGEILLNYAEAAMELGKIDEATDAVNLIRARAGIQVLTTAEMTKDIIRHEREVELAFEGGQRYWDIRRWHIADELINNRKYTALYPYYVMDDDAYIFKAVKVGFSLTFYPKLYYEKIPASEITKNSRLVQNPNY